MSAIAPTWRSIGNRFGIAGSFGALAGVKLDRLALDDCEIESALDQVERDLGVRLEHPCMYRTLGDIAAYCIRQLQKKEARACR